MPTLYILCGLPASGKSTWAKNFIAENFEDDIRRVSRDEIRFSLLKEGEDYFSHEKEVFKKFSITIAQTLVDGFDVIADATHLNEFSRNKLIKAIDYYTINYQIIYVVFNISLFECIKRDNKRIGIFHVGKNAILNMNKRFYKPQLSEDKRAKEIIEIG